MKNVRYCAALNFSTFYFTVFYPLGRGSVYQYYSLLICFVSIDNKSTAAPRFLSLESYSAVLLCN